MHVKTNQFHTPWISNGVPAPLEDTILGKIVWTLGTLNLIPALFFNVVIDVTA